MPWYHRINEIVSSPQVVVLHGNDTVPPTCTENEVIPAEDREEIWPKLMLLLRRGNLWWRCQANFALSAFYTPINMLKVYVYIIFKLPCAACRCRVGAERRSRAAFKPPLSAEAAYIIIKKACLHDSHAKLSKLSLAVTNIHPSACKHWFKWKSAFQNSFQ